ncbi:hypothetical protein IC762_32470 [Bradyrhizobium genosp. L]|uniref:hypothetical protein n=1 Tax=Bradyrhizobium genosp. L TaxID=83637 RepID=UPI0018A2BEA9|nr:hypothetical protein [Bradyrhizobium genosp. L]QPF84281.1 hypothetical protein IC762_32470 [Bradyrhizobium genosp. L]
MSLLERSQPRQSTVRFPEIGETAWLVAIAVGFLVLHILVATLLMPAAVDDPTMPRQEPKALTD